MLTPGDPVTHRPRVFGIGFHKTGTTSLGLALERLGYRVCHGADPVRKVLGNEEMMRLLHAGDFEPVFRVAERFDAFQDNPWFCLYREMDRRFPGSRFILTVRSERRWMDSVVNHFGRTDSDFRRWIYGTGSPIGNEGHFLNRYRRHNREVRAHFADRPGDLLVLSLEEGDGWPELCAYLGVSVPEGPFPHANRRVYPMGVRSLLRKLVTRWRAPGGT